MPTHAFTIRKLADAAGISVETVRYYQRRGLLEEPQRVENGFREYSEQDVRRLRFIRRAQDLGFSLDAIAELASLSETKDQARARELARVAAADIRRRVAELESMAAALDTMVACCARSVRTAPCQIIAALAEEPTPSGTTALVSAADGARRTTAPRRPARGAALPDGARVRS